MADRDGIAFQHRRLETFLGEFAEALAREDRRLCETAAFRLQGAVNAHFDVEEQVVFPSVRDVHAEVSSALDALESDHRRLRYELESLSLSVVSSDAVTVNGVLHAFWDALNLHERTEEGILSQVQERPHSRDDR